MRLSVSGRLAKALRAERGQMGLFPQNASRRTLLVVSICVATIVATSAVIRAAQADPPTAYHWVKVSSSKPELCAAISSVIKLHNVGAPPPPHAHPGDSDFNWPIFPGGKPYQLMIAPLSDDQLLAQMQRHADRFAAYEYARRLHHKHQDDLALQYVSLGVRRGAPAAFKIESDGRLSYSMEQAPEWGFYSPSACLAVKLCGSAMTVQDNLESLCPYFPL